MTSTPGVVVPDYEQAIAFHDLLMQRLGIEEPGPVNDAVLKRTLDRFHAMVQSRERDIFWVSAFLMFELIRGNVFGKGSAQTGVALPFAFLYRNGIMITPSDETEVTGVAFGIKDGAVYVAMVEEWLRQCARRA